MIWQALRLDTQKCVASLVRHAELIMFTHYCSTSNSDMLVDLFPFTTSEYHYSYSLRKKGRKIREYLVENQQNFV